MIAVIAAYKDIAGRALSTSSFGTTFITYYGDKSFVWVCGPYVTYSREQSAQLISAVYDIVEQHGDLFDLCAICHCRRANYKIICKLVDSNHRIGDAICYSCKVLVDASRPVMCNFTLIDGQTAIWSDQYNHMFTIMFAPDTTETYNVYIATNVIAPQMSMRADYIEAETRFRAFLDARLVCRAMGAPDDIFMLIIAHYQLDTSYNIDIGEMEHVD